MELYQLRTFVIVAEEGNLTRAAQRLFMTPSSVSVQIKALEDELNVSLFVRTPRGMEITEKGKLLRTKAEQTLQAAQDLVNHATEMQHHLMGSLQIGLNAAPNFLKIAQLVAAMQEDCPGIALSFVASVSGKIIDSLKDGSLDVGYIFGASPCAEVRACRLGTADLVIAGPKQWQTELESADWAGIAGMPWIFSTIYCPFEVMTDRLFQRRGLARRQTVHAGDEATKCELVGAALGLALLEKSEANQAAQAGKIVIWETEPIQCELCLAYLARRGDDPLIRVVRATALKIWDNYSCQV